LHNAYENPAVAVSRGFIYKDDYVGSCPKQAEHEAQYNRVMLD